MLVLVILVMIIGVGGTYEYFAATLQQGTSFQGYITFTVNNNENKFSATS